MNAHLLSIFLLSFPASGIHAQVELWGAAEYGGKDNLGVLYRVVNGEYEVVKDFLRETRATGAFSGQMFTGTDGRLFGLARCDADEGAALMLVFDPATGTYAELDFMAHDVGNDPTGHLVETMPGVFMGVCRSGGANNAGTIFSFNQSVNAFTKLYDMEPAVAGTPDGGLVLHSSGLLYGASRTGGNTGNGVIYSFDPNDLVLEVAHAFQTAHATPRIPAFTADESGLIFGVRADQSAPGGALFSFDPASGTFEERHLFPEQELLRPVHGLTWGPDGLLYGTTDVVAGTVSGSVYRFDPMENAYSIVTNLMMPTIGSPACAPAFHGSGELSIFTSENGLSGPWWEPAKHLVIDPQSGSLLHASQNGASSSQLSGWSDGRLYCISSTGIHSYEISGHEGPQVDFTTIPISGSRPATYLIKSSTDHITGICRTGGFYGQGYLFQLDPFTLAFDSLISIPSGYGSALLRTKLIELEPNVFLFTRSGVLIKVELNTQTVSEVVLLSSAGLQGASGQLVRMGSLIFGTSPGGGEHGRGALWQYDLISGELTVCHSFADHGTDPWAAHHLGELNGLPDGRILGSFRMPYPDEHYSYLFTYDPGTNAFQTFSTIETVNGHHHYAGFSGEADEQRWSHTYQWTSGGSAGLSTYDPTSGQTDVVHAVAGFQANGLPTVASDGRIYYTMSTSASPFTPIIIAWDPVQQVVDTIHVLTSPLDGRTLMGGMLETSFGVGVSSHETPSSFHLSPNPVKDQLRISWTPNESAMVQVLDPQGRTIGSFLARPGLNTMDVGHLPNGTYLLTTVGSDGPTGSVRFVVAR